MPAFGPTVVQKALGKHSATVFIMHGLGDSGQGLSAVAPPLALPHTKFVFPTAPARPITLNGGARMNGWFDIGNIQTLSAGLADTQGIAESTTYLSKLIDDEIASGIPSERIVIGGFSQGGHVALKTLLKYPAKLAGCIALSTWLEPAAAQGAGANKATDIFIGHGTADQLIPLFLSNVAKTSLQQKGYSKVAYHSYAGMGHSTCPDELTDLKKFLAQVVPDKPPTREELAGMSVKELRAFLTSQGVSCATFLEKRDFVEKAQSLV